jgi:hypothetical protein
VDMDGSVGAAVGTDVDAGATVGVGASAQLTNSRPASPTSIHLITSIVTLLSTSPSSPLSGKTPDPETRLRFLHQPL